MEAWAFRVVEISSPLKRAGHAWRRKALGEEPARKPSTRRPEEGRGGGRGASPISRISRTGPLTAVSVINSIIPCMIPIKSTYVDPIELSRLTGRGDFDAPPVAVRLGAT
jgi:hypothetical protein